MKTLQITTRGRSQGPLLHLHRQSPPIGPLLATAILSMTLSTLSVLMVVLFVCEGQEEWMMEV